ncbi:hypothetical protein HS088_TW23G00559 [Tripterygium wilfordii]|uniref:Uncharacterized protein n=1 Tax=Tripterygium wilfordii TaxID=458696 RepID=A0A7J7BVB9_TRIWF|nr:hypothetical protein HS088_TW23G00559 [Tripterygium wilfordii]
MHVSSAKMFSTCIKSFIASDRGPGVGQADELLGSVTEDDARCFTVIHDEIRNKPMDLRIEDSHPCLFISRLINIVDVASMDYQAQSHLNILIQEIQTSEFLFLYISSPNVRTKGKEFRCPILQLFSVSLLPFTRLYTEASQSQSVESFDVVEKIPKRFQQVS